MNRRWLPVIRPGMASSGCYRYTVSPDSQTSIEAMALMLAAADKKDVFSRFAKLFESNLAIIPAEMQAQADLKLFTRAAIERGARARHQIL